MKFIAIVLLLKASLTLASAPSWYVEYKKTIPDCESALLCVLGEGDSIVEAQREARTEAAKFFQTKISSKSLISSFSEQRDNQILGNFEEFISKNVSEETTEALSGLEIKKQEQVDGRIYLIMSLDKEKSAQGFKTKIEQLDAENVQLFDSLSRFTYPKIFRNLASIAPLEERYSLLSSKPLKLKLSKDFMLEKLNKLNPIKMALVSQTVRLPEKLKHILTEIFAPLKVILTSKKNAPQYTLKTQLLSEDQYLKVAGFKRLQIIFRLEVLNAKAEVLGRISTSSVQVARNREQAIDMAITELKENIIENLNQLSLANADNSTLNKSGDHL